MKNSRKRKIIALAGDTFGFTYNGTEYLYLKNLQNDVVAIVDNVGSIVVKYTYDAWGRPYKTTGTLANTIGKINPIRYRSYYYDTVSSIWS